MMVMKMMIIVVVVVCVLGWGSDDVAAGAAPSMQEKCGADFQKLAVCLSYATGKAAAPKKDCCESVKGIKDSEPECLCFIMQQTHGGNDKIKSMGIQESKLLALPSACALKNATLAECPKLLGLSPSSPDAAIFTNASAPAASATSTTTATGGGGVSQTQSSNDASSGPSVGPHLAGLLALAVSAIAALAFP